MRYEFQQLLSIHGLQVRETFPGDAQVVSLRQLSQRGRQEREHDSAVDGLPLPAGAWKEMRELDVSVPVRCPAVRNAPSRPADAAPGVCSPSALRTRDPSLFRTATCPPPSRYSLYVDPAVSDTALGFPGWAQNPPSLQAAVIFIILVLRQLGLGAAENGWSLQSNSKAEKRGAKDRGLSGMPESE